MGSVVGVSADFAGARVEFVFTVGAGELRIAGLQLRQSENGQFVSEYNIRRMVGFARWIAWGVFSGDGDRVDPYRGMRAEGGRICC